jgi:predicted lipoprotein with Yx(FWY)xxD motif
MLKKATMMAVLLGTCLSASALAQSTGGNMSGATPNPNSTNSIRGLRTFPAQVVTTDKGPILVNIKGMTLYTYDKDSNGQSSCNGACAQNWPPLLASTHSLAGGNWSIITRSDGEKQWAYKGKPLYTWSKDTKPGDTTGDGIKAAWHVARP